MDENVRTTLLGALGHVFQPMVRLAIRNGLSFDDFTYGLKRVFVEAAIDLTVGLDLILDGSALGAIIGTPPPGDISATILVNRMGTPDVTLDALLPLLVSVALPQLAGSIGSFPLPTFLDLDLQLVDVDRSGDFLSLFLDFSSI